MKIGKQIKLIRTEKDIKQYDLARELGITSQYLSAIENGKRSPSFKLLEKIATTFNVDVKLTFADLNK